MPTDTRAPVEILLVEDNDDDANLAQRALTREGLRCHVSRARAGEECLAILYKQGQHSGAPSPALMLLDLAMPKKGGLDVLEEIRGSGDPELKTLPVIILTTSMDFGDAKRALNLKARAFMSKPVK